MCATRVGEPQGAATARAPREATATIGAPLLRSLIEPLAEDRRWRILDLGAARPETLDLLSGFRCRVDIADLTEEVERHSGSSAPHALVDDIVLPLVRDPEPADIVLCWDLLNYLDRNALSRLMAQIAARCRAGALVHALIVYSERVMHDQPGQYALVDAGTLLDRARSPGTRPAPRYSTEALSLAMPDYTVERVRLLVNGMQEYLFRTRPLRDALVDASPAAAYGSKPIRRGRAGGLARAGVWKIR